MRSAPRVHGPLPNPASAHLRGGAYSTPRPTGSSTNDAQSSPSSIGLDTSAPSSSTPLRSATSSTLRPPPGLPIPATLRGPPLRREGYQPYRFGHLAFPYIEAEMKRKQDAAKNNNGAT